MVAVAEVASPIDEFPMAELKNIEVSVLAALQQDMSIDVKYQHVIDDLEKRGFVERRPVYFLTDKGKKEYAELFPDFPSHPSG